MRDSWRKDRADETRAPFRKSSGLSRLSTAISRLTLARDLYCSFDVKRPGFLRHFIFAAATLIAASARAQNDGSWQLQKAVILQGFGDDTPDLFYEAGYRVEAKHLQGSYVLGPLASKIFEENKKLRSNMPSTTPKAFLPVVRAVNDFILKQEKIRASSNEDKNGVKNWALAVRITRLSFCFGTDPIGVASQIQIESSYDRTKVSATGAVGFTQMTSAAIDEVNDQLGNRGVTGAREENLPYIYQSIRCYMGGRAFAPMFLSNIIPRGKLVSDDARLRNAAKAWLRADVDRDLIYGQITLKTLLAVASAQGLRGKAAYAEALRRYNGEPNGGARQYSRDVMAHMKGRST